jgi:hypothetical protein
MWMPVRPRPVVAINMKVRSADLRAKTAGSGFWTFFSSLFGQATPCATAGMKEMKNKDTPA